jgi:drug/metabolite transporter (DMT)-like permease
MLASLLTTLGFSLSVIFAARSARLLGGPTANLARLSLATVCLALWAHLFGTGLAGGAFFWFFLSGIVGFGIGDMALFGALNRIGPRLSILLTQCLAAPIGAFTEWHWLGTTLTARELGCAGVILAGVALALAPDRGWAGDHRGFTIGILLGILSAVGQAFGAVISRKANLMAELAGLKVDGGTAAYQRILGGILVTALAFAFVRQMRPAAGEVDVGKWRRAWPFVIANAAAGPVLGVACYQWALSTTPTGIVLALVATAPLLTMLLGWLIDGTQPTRRGALGSVIAVAGAAGLQYFSVR